MADRVHPRACRVCGPGGREPCIRCQGFASHAHVVVVGRDGRPCTAPVALCGTCLKQTTRGKDLPLPARRRGPGRPKDPQKLLRDRERRAAQRTVLDRHADEVTAELARIRGAA